MHIMLAADAAIERFGKDAPTALADLIAAAVRFGDDDLVTDFDRVLREVERRLGIDAGGARQPSA